MTMQKFIDFLEGRRLADDAALAVLVQPPSTVAPVLTICRLSWPDGTELAVCISFMAGDLKPITVAQALDYLRQQPGDLLLGLQDNPNNLEAIGKAVDACAFAGEPWVVLSRYTRDEVLASI